MEQPNGNEQLAIASGNRNDARPPTASNDGHRLGSVASQEEYAAYGAPVPNNGPPATPNYVYAIGTIEARFPSISVEKEVAQAIGRASTAGLTDRQALQNVLSQRQNRYLARQLCWVMTMKVLKPTFWRLVTRRTWIC
jgi:hypothetical protein